MLLESQLMSARATAEQHQMLAEMLLWTGLENLEALTPLATEPPLLPDHEDHDEKPMNSFNRKLAMNDPLLNIRKSVQSVRASERDARIALSHAPTLHASDAPRPPCRLRHAVPRLVQEEVAADAKPADVDYYTCTMHPSVRKQSPKDKCPICSMDLEPVKKREGASRASERPSVEASRSDAHRRSTLATLQTLRRSSRSPSRASSKSALPTRRLKSVHSRIPFAPWA